MEKELGLLTEIYKIKKLMLAEEFKANKDIVPKYVDSILEKIGGEKFFDRFFNGEATLREFKDKMVNKIIDGDYGDNFSEVTKNLQYLKNIGAIIGTLDRRYKNDEESFPENEENSYETLKEKTLYGQFCKNCKNQTDVNNELDRLLDIENKIKKNWKNLKDSGFNPNDINMAFTLYGKDPGKLFPYLSTKFKNVKTLFGLLGKGGFLDRLDKTKEEWGIKGYDFSGNEKYNTMKTLPKYYVKFEEPLIYKDASGNSFEIKYGETLIFNYDRKDDLLIHKLAEKRKSNVNVIKLELDGKPEMGKRYEAKLKNVIPIKGKAFNIEPGSKYSVKIKIEEE
jgi:hypothetical protein